MHIVKVSSRGQVVLPAEARNKLGIKEGDTLTVSIDEDTKIVLKTTRKDRVKKGIVAKTAGLLADMEMGGKEYIENIRKGSGRRLDEIEGNS